MNNGTAPPRLLTRSLRFAFRLVLLLWIVHLGAMLLGLELGYLGVLPRTVTGLWGILFSPLIHADFTHLISNSVPLFVLTTILMYFYRRVATSAFLMLYVLTGLAVWLLADLPLVEAILGLGRGRSFHIGASGVVYALAAFVVASGAFRRNLRAVILALIVVFLYGGMIWGVLPTQPGVSWESHLLGGIVGVFVAYWFKESVEHGEQRPQYSWEEQPEPERERRPYYFDRDLFERTKKERRQDNANGSYRLPDWFQ